MFPAILTKPLAECTPAERAKQAQAWDVIVKVAATHAASQGFAPTESEMPEFERVLASSLEAHAQKVAAEQAKPGIYATLFGTKTASRVTEADIDREARDLVSSPEYAALFA